MIFGLVHCLKKEEPVADKEREPPAKKTALDILLGPDSTVDMVPALINAHN